MVLDMTKLALVDDITCDCWWWQQLSLYTVVCDNEPDDADFKFRKPLKNEMITAYHKVVQRTYRMTKDSQLTKTIVTSSPCGVDATKGSEQFRNEVARLKFS